MNDDTFRTFIFTLFGSLLAFAVGMAIGVNVGHSNIRNEAIKVGVAEWVVDPVTGERAFQYLVAPK